MIDLAGRAHLSSLRDPFYRSLANGSYWSYAYDELGQVTSGRHYWVDDTLVAGQQFEYVHEDIGNRTSTARGGNAAGANLLNQYDDRQVPDAVDVVGVATSTATVTVEGTSARRQGAYFWAEPTLDNSAGPVWEQIDVESDEGGTPYSDSGDVFLPATPETFTYDDDGNLTSDSLWDYTWDAENRLVKMVSRTLTPAGPDRWIEFEYDWRGRRIGKKVWYNTTGTGTADVEEKFVYDGWNLMAKLSASDSIVARFVWGLDLSGTEQGAGGVGGLLWLRAAGPPPQFAAYDGNGNVTALVNGNGGSVTATYEYGPFGELIRSTGSRAEVNPLRFSTQYQDDETDLIDYGHRYYNPSTGSWPNRDPIGDTAFLSQITRDESRAKQRHLREESLMPAYLFVLNDPVSNRDADGLVCGSWWNDWLVPENPYRVSPCCDADFTVACREHDECYGTIGKKRMECDLQFYCRMQKACKSQNSWRICIKGCEAYAALYFKAVQRFGEDAYRSAQQSSGNELPDPGDAEWDKGRDWTVDENCNVTVR